MTAEGRKGEGKVLDEDQQVCRTHGKCDFNGVGLLLGIAKLMFLKIPKTFSSTL